jgi:cyclase
VTNYSDLRLIPTLLLLNEDLVKTKKFKIEKYLGDPINAVSIFSSKEVDELILLDIGSNHYGFKLNYDFLKSIASSAFMPLTYGGGISNMSQAESIFSLGFEKLSLNSSLQTDPQFIQQCISSFGSQSIVASIDLKLNNLGQYEVYSHSKKNTLSNINFLDYIDYVCNLKVGELMINVIDRDGCKSGYDIHLFDLISRQFKLPIIACGGSKNIQDVHQLFESTNVSAAAGSTMFVYTGALDAVLLTYNRV